MTRKPILSLLAAALLAACASYDGRGLAVGVADEAGIVRTMGQPAMRWTLPDGATQFAYPRGPAGVHTYMVRIDANGKLANIENALTPKTFARVEAGMSGDDVLRLLGPSEPSWTAYFRARDELVWEWRYCNDWHKLARFDVLFDATAKRVRSTLERDEEQTDECGKYDTCWCSR
jgi:hypothetical protein